MVRVRFLFAAMLAAAALAVLAVPATAATPTANSSKFCTAVSKIGSQSTGQPTKAQAKKLISQFKSAAKSAPAKVKAAIGKITKYLDVVANGDVSDLANLAQSNDFKDYTAAIGTYTNYVATNCT
jgi:hypothetical protein